MKSIKKIIRGEKIIFDYSGIVFFEKSKTLVCADLHLGKSISFASNGNFIPPFDLVETLNKFHDVINKYKPKKLISLGDSFHERNSIEKITNNYIDILNNLLKEISTIWIEGNHDYNLLMKEKIPGEFKEGYILKKFRFVHSKSKINNDHFEFSGHFHPKISFRLNGLKYSYKCFVLTKNFCIMPSFGTFTGGLDIKSDELQKILPDSKKILLLGSKEIKEI